MNIDIWSDVVCPFCFVGKKQLEKALANFEHRDEVSVTYHSFELNPDAPITTTQSMYEMLAEKYGMDEGQARANNQRIFGTAGELGITFNFDDVILTNSFDSHRLIHFAHAHGKQAEMKERIQKAYFTDGLNIGNRDVLATLANEIGLDKEAVATVLENDEYTQEVRADEKQARELGISGVPFFVIDMTYGVSGAQGEENLLAALNEAWTKANN